jgi:hypothetical protein
MSDLGARPLEQPGMANMDTGKAVAMLSYHRLAVTGAVFFSRSTRSRMVCSGLLNITYAALQCGFVHLLAILTLPIIHLYGEVVKLGWICSRYRAHLTFQLEYYTLIWTTCLR